MKRRVLDRMSQWGISALVHALVLAVLAMFHVDLARKPKTATVLTELSELAREEEFLEKLETIDLSAPVALVVGGGSSLATPAEVFSKPPDPFQTVGLTQVTANRNLLRPLATAGGKLALGGNVAGLKGISSTAPGEGGMGAVDQITQEILRQLDKGKTLVVWLMDSSGSLEQRREQIAQRIDRVHRELDELGVNQNDALLTTVVSFGASSRFLLDKPTSQAAAVSQAIRQIKDDETGLENVFAAIRETVLKYRRYQVSGHRSLMLIVLTDETGDDGSLVDETTEFLKRNRVPVYVLGPTATFSVPILHVTAVNKETQEVFWVPILRGPEGRADEILRVPFNGTPYFSGYGPFALSRVALETGGIYFLFDDERVRARAYDREVLMRYKPYYGTGPEYTAQVGQSSLRRTLMEVVQEGNRIWHFNWPDHGLPQANLRDAAEARQRSVAPFLAFADKSLARLKSVEAERESELNLRWRANYDLTMARLLQAKVRCEEYNDLLARLKSDPPILKDPKKHNGWLIRGDRELRAGVRQKAEAGPSAAKPAPKAAAETSQPLAPVQRLAQEAARWFDRVLKEHAGTVWAEAARRERDAPLGVTISEHFFAPPGKPPKGKAPKL